ncbi:MAG: hypothetical protein P8179_14350 [Candidatus Thiodiazotropha sp.]|jgi:hypothetical protein
MSKIDNCLNLIEKIENRSYRGKNRVVITVDDIATLTDLFDEVDSESKDFIRDCISEKVGKVLIGFTGEMARKSVESGDIKWLKRALIVHILEDVQFDYRENLRELFLLLPAFKSLDVSKDDIWNSVMPLASDRVKEYLVPRF